MENKESKLKKILFWNLGIYFSLSIIEIIFLILLSMNEEKSYLGLLFMIFSSISLVAQVSINFILAAYFFIKNFKDIGAAFLISALVILLIGFPLCFFGGLLG